MRQLIANGKFKIALENAKEFHKVQRTPASEALLLDAYAARIQSLLDQNLKVEAKSLFDLVRERFPSAGDRLDRCLAAVSASTGDLAVLLRPLNDAQLLPERRAAIEQIIQTEVTDLAALADCDALDPQHSLRRAAAALDRAFIQVTSGPVTDEELALPEVSYRSPLAAWKLLIRAIASLYRDERQACQECLAAIKPESAPYRLVPAIETILGVQTAAPLKPAAVALVSRVSVGLAELRSALSNVDRAFEHSGDEEKILKAIRIAVRECQRSAPDRLDELRQITAVRGEAGFLDERRLREALGGAPRRDAAFFRMYAVATENSREDEDLLDACEAWEKFREHAIKEGWFRANGVEVATLYLHMAEVLERIPDRVLKELQRSQGFVSGQTAAEDIYFLFPEKLYARACSLDPHPEAFAQWMRWAKGQSQSKAEVVAREWSRICPEDITPVLYLMEEAEKRNAFPTALSYLEKAERIDAVHSKVRAARLRLLAAGAMSHLQKKKPHLAAEKLAIMAGLPQSQQGDRPAFLAALRQLICRFSGDEAGATEARQETERLLGNSVAAAVLTFGVASIAKRPELVFLPLPKQLTQQERKTIPASLARLMALARDFGIKKFALPVPYFAEAVDQFPVVRDSLDVEQVAALGQLGLATDHPKLAWAASQEGLKRGGPSEAQFLLLRAHAVPPGHESRQEVLAAAAAELGRFHRDMSVVDEAVEIVRDPFGGESVSLTLDQARDVVQRELRSSAFPSRSNQGPDYHDLVPADTPCQCPDCRRQRKEAEPDTFDYGQSLNDKEDEFELDEGEMEKIFKEAVPKDIPPAFAQQMFEVLKQSFRTGESPEEIMSRVFGDPGKKKKGRRER